MKPNTKKRLIWSPVGGLFIPNFYLLLLNLFDHLFHKSISPVMRWLAMPLLWPAYIYDLVVPKPVEPVISEMPGPGFWLYLAAANVLLYSFLTYLLIRRRQSMPRLR
jgi:hypothetical protein